MTWRSTLALAVVIGLIAFCGAIVIQKAWAQAKGPADFEFAGGAQGKVVFSHEKHAAKNPKCTDCHTKIFQGSAQRPQDGGHEHWPGLWGVP
jgi:hypothetical protein